MKTETKLDIATKLINLGTALNNDSVMYQAVGIAHAQNGQMLQAKLNHEIGKIETKIGKTLGSLGINIGKKVMYNLSEEESEFSETY